MAKAYWIVDARVPAWQSLPLNLDPDAEVVLSGPAADGISQIVDALRGDWGPSALSIVSHGSEDTLPRGATPLTASLPEGYAREQSDIGSAFPASSDSGSISEVGGGVDSLAGRDGHDALPGGAGNNVLYGGKGTDSAEASGTHPDGANPVLYWGKATASTIFGTSDNDTLSGTDADDSMEGLGGNDVLYGGRGDDMLSGGAGNDYLRGDAALESSATGSGADSLSGGDGDDTLLGGAGNDVLYGGKGTDTAEFSGAYADYTISALYGGKNGAVLCGYQVSSAAEGVDFIGTDVEYLRFSDRQMAMESPGLPVLPYHTSYHVSPPTAGEAQPFVDSLDPFVDILDNGATAHINLVGLAQTGLEYVWAGSA